MNHEGFWCKEGSVTTVFSERHLVLDKAMIIKAIKAHITNMVAEDGEWIAELVLLDAAGKGGIEISANVTLYGGTRPAGSSQAREGEKP